MVPMGDGQGLAISVKNTARIAKYNLLKNFSIFNAVERIKVISVNKRSQMMKVKHKSAEDHSERPGAFLPISSSAFSRELFQRRKVFFCNCHAQAKSSVFS